MLNWRVRFSDILPVLMALEYDDRLEDAAFVPCHCCIIQNLSPKQGLYRCVECACEELWCLDCIRVAHRRTPFHHFQVFCFSLLYRLRF